MLEFRFLGSLEIARDGDPLTLPKSRKTLALLAYLIVSGRRQRRDHLCSMLWELPDDPRAALRWSLSKIRTLVDEPEHPRIVANRNMVAFERAGAYIDLLAIREACPIEVEGLSTERLAELADAFRGEFLEGLELPNCPKFQAWCLAERGEARALHIKILRALMEQLSGDPEAARPHARALAELEADGDWGHVQVARRSATEQGDESVVEERSRTGGPSLPAAMASVAVLPFENMSDDPAQRYFADGISEDITTGLVKLESFTVIARTSSFEYKGRLVNVRAIGRELGALYVVHGSVRKVGRRVRITAQLVEAESGNHLWAEHYDRQIKGIFKGIFAIQDEITQAIVTAVEHQIRSAENWRKR